MLRLVVCLVFFFGFASAQVPSFEPGQTMPGFGKVAPYEGLSFTPPAGQPFRVVFDVENTVREGENHHISKVARFINMHGEGALDPRPLDIVVVIHGRAVGDVTAERRNAQRELVQALLDQGVRFVVCGQSLAGLQVPQDALIDGVDVALSAMTAHASLIGQGYASMPF